MATSGTFNTNSTSWYGDGYTLTTYVKVDWTRTSFSTENNTSTISVTGTVKSNLGPGYTRGWYDKQLIVDGTTYNDSTYYNVGSEGQIYSKTGIVINHTSDGSKSFDISFKVKVGQNNSWTCTGSGTFTLETIPRASSFSLTSSSIYTTGNIAGTITRASTSFTHDVKLTYNNTDYSLATGQATSFTASVPSGLKTVMKNGSLASVSCVVTVTTKSGSTAIGTATNNITISAPNATISTTTTSVAVNSATAQWSLGSTDTAVCTYTVQRYLGSITYTDQTKTTTTSKSNGANANFLQSTTNAKEGTVTTKVTTYVGNTQVGTNTTTYKVTIPSSYGPSIAIVSGYPKKYSDTASYGGYYLAGYSGVQWQATGSVGSGSYATISSITAAITAGYGTLSTTVSGSTITSSLTKLNGSSSDYTQTVTFTVTDSRGYSSTISSSITAKGYSLPVFDMANTWAKRATSGGTLDNEGTYANLSAKATVHSITYITSLVIKTGSTTVKTVSNSTTSVKTLTATQNAYGTYAITTEGNFSAIATDAMGKSTTVDFVLPKAAVHLSLYEGNPGVGIGTIAQANRIDTPLPIISSSGTPLKFNSAYSAAQTYNLIQVKDAATPSQYGAIVAFGGTGGCTIIGAGESTNKYFTDDATDEEWMYITSDQGVRFYVGANTYANKKLITIDASGRIVIGEESDTSAEKNVQCWGGAGGISLYSVASTTGNRGIWAYAHGTATTGKAVITVDTNNNVTLNGNAATATSATSATSATDATNAANVGITNTNPSSGTWYYPTWVSSTSGNLPERVNNGYRYYSLNGTADTAGHAIIQVGNSTATGTAGNKTGRIRLYTSSSGYVDIYSTGNTSNRSIYIPVLPAPPSDPPANAEFQVTVNLWTGTLLGGNTQTVSGMANYRRVRIYAIAVGSHNLIWEQDVSKLHASTYHVANASQISYFDSDSAWFTTVFELSMTKTVLNLRNVYNMKIYDANTWNKNNNADYYIYRVDGII